MTKRKRKTKRPLTPEEYDLIILQPARRLLEEIMKRKRRTRTRAKLKTTRRSKAR